MSNDKLNVKIVSNQNSVELNKTENKVVVTDKTKDTSVTVLQKETSVVTIGSKGPKGDAGLKGDTGPKGDKGDIGTVILSSSFGGGVIITGSLLVSGSFGESVTITQNLIVSGTITSPGSDREIVFNSGSFLGSDPNFVFDSLGRLGIGTTNPTTKLEVVGSDAIINSVNIGRGGGNIVSNTAIGNGALSNISGEANSIYNTAIGLNAGSKHGGHVEPLISASYSVFIGSETRADANNQQNQIVIGYGTIGLGSNTVVLGNGEIQKTILRGNVGIGTTNPTAKLEVLGSDAIINSVNIGRGGGNISTNTRFGTDALLNNTTGIDNTAIGKEALRNNTLGRYNTAIGREALRDNTSGSDNTAIGKEALRNNTLGNSNTAIGREALFFVSGVEQDANTAIGYSAGSYLSSNNNPPLAKVKYSVFIGADTKANANNEENQIVIGYGAESLGSNTVVLGNDQIVKTILRGNVGIGTTSPTNTLQVVGGVTAISFTGSLFGTASYSLTAENIDGGFF